MKYLNSLILLLVGCGSGVHGSPGAGMIDWSAPSESLIASSLTLSIDGVTFHGTMDQFEMKAGSTGDAMDVTWAEGGYMPRVHFDFNTDHATWWIGSVRAYALDNSGWIEEMGAYYKTPAAQAYEGDLDFTIDLNSHHAEIHLPDARLATLGVP